MTAAHLTPAQARRLGLDVPTTGTGAGRTRKVARAPYRTRCTRCGTEFTSEAAEERHLIAEHHARYELVVAS